MKTQTTTWKQKFFTIWAGQAISLITSGILQMVIIFHLTDKTGSPLVLSIASFVGFLPQAIFGPWIGVLVDRYNRKLIMIVSDLFIALAGAFLAIIALFMELPVWLVLLILFIRSIGTAFHSPAISAITPLMVPENHLTKCAGYTSAIQSVGSIVSPAVAGILYSVWSLEKIIALDIIGAIFACATVAIVAIPKSKAANEPATETESFLSEMQEGFNALRQNKGLFALLWIGALYMFAYMPINALFPLMSMQYFGGTAFHASVAEIAFALGMLCGGVVLGLWGGFKRRTLTIATSILIMGISLLVSGILPATGYMFFIICCVFMGISAPFYGVQTALFQEKIKAEYLGRVFSLFGSVVSVAMPLGLILSGLFAEIVGVSNWFLISGVFIVGIAILTRSIPSIQTLNEAKEDVYSK